MKLSIQVLMSVFTILSKIAWSTSEGRFSRKKQVRYEVLYFITCQKMIVTLIPVKFSSNIVDEIDMGR